MREVRVVPYVTAAMAGFLLPFSWLAGLAARWLPDLRFEWSDYLLTWEYDGRPFFWALFGAGFALALLFDAALLGRLLLH